MSEYVGPIVTVDSALLRVRGGELQVLLHERPKEPFAGKLALPGVYVQVGETMDQAARRALAVKCGVVLPDTTVVRTVDVYDAIDRDPRGHALSIITVTFTDQTERELSPGARWAPLVAANGLALAFDHDAILDELHRWVSARMWSDQQVLAGLLGSEPLTTANIRRALAAVSEPGATTNMVARLARGGMIAPSAGETVRHDGPGRPSKVWVWA